MNQKYIPWIIAVVILIAGTGFLAFNKSKDNKLAAEKSKMESEAMMHDDEASMSPEEDKIKDQKMMTDEDKMAENNSMMMKTGHYKDYSAETVKSEQAAGNKVVLFFHATWCPYCRAADKAFLANPDSIPSGVTVLKTDYDSNTDLKKKYGVTYQHTFVQIDNNGDKVTSWISGDIELLKKNVK